MDVDSMLLSRVGSASCSLPLVFALAGCDMSLGNLTGRATDEWTRTYPLSPGGEVRIVNTNGRIDVEGVDGLDRRGPGRAHRPRRHRRRRPRAPAAHHHQGRHPARPRRRSRPSG